MATFSLASSGWLNGIVNELRVAISGNGGTFPQDVVYLIPTIGKVSRAGLPSPADLFAQPTRFAKAILLSNQ
jgi:hypothetical protein